MEKNNRQYDRRFYRAWHEQSPLERFELKIEESDLLILCDRVTPAIKSDAERTLRHARQVIKQKIHRHPQFLQSLSPVAVNADDQDIVRTMAKAGYAWSVGPMAAVAGAVAESVARALSSHSKTVIVENGGDVYALSNGNIRFGLYAGESSPFKDTLTFEVDATNGVAVCTSSGKIGPSLSFGHADAVAAIHHSGSHADAAATAIANRIQTPDDVGREVDAISTAGQLVGLIACMEDKLGLLILLNSLSQLVFR